MNKLMLEPCAKRAHRTGMIDLSVRRKIMQTNVPISPTRTHAGHKET